jgi:hypothetical protein
VRPSGLKATLSKPPVRPVSERPSGRWLATPHSRIILSPPAEASLRPSGLEEAGETNRCPSKRLLSTSYCP